MSGWGRELATIWTNNVAPSRPSNSEMCVYTKYLRQLRETFRRRIKILILGSTPEFRDWGYEENLIIHVVDKSEDYYNTVSREIRHKISLLKPIKNYKLDQETNVVESDQERIFDAYFSPECFNVLNEVNKDQVIDSLLQRMSQGEDEQFVECDITMKELSIIEKNIVASLNGTFHSRIEYPKIVKKPS